MDRNLDGYYFRVKRGDGYDNICWSDLTREEKERMIERYDIEALRRFCIGLGEVIKEIGDSCDIVCN